MNIKIVCSICGNPLSIMATKVNKGSIVFQTAFCGYCETMATKVQKELIASQHSAAPDSEDGIVGVCPVLDS